MTYATFRQPGDETQTISEDPSWVKGRFGITNMPGMCTHQCCYACEGIANRLFLANAKHSCYLTFSLYKYYYLRLVFIQRALKDAETPSFERRLNHVSCQQNPCGIYSTHKDKKEHSGKETFASTSNPKHQQSPKNANSQVVIFLMLPPLPNKPSSVRGSTARSPEDRNTGVLICHARPGAAETAQRQMDVTDNRSSSPPGASYHRASQHNQRLLRPPPLPLPPPSLTPSFPRTQSIITTLTATKDLYKINK